MKPLIFSLMLALAGAVHGAPVSMAFGDNLPPYIMAESHSGIELDVVREALALRGHELRPQYGPMGRIPFSFIEGKVDAIMMDVGEDMAAHGGHYGEAPVLYDNVLYTLKRRQLRLRKPADLKGLSIMAFVGAAKRYPEWLLPLSRTPEYVERNNQAVQPLLLSLGRYDVVLSDRTIFQYFSALQRRADPHFVLPAVEEHALPPPDPRDYRPVFRDAAVRDDYNAGLEQLRKSGRYKAIYGKYLEK
ncbi:polar amino acid transport system substrate-binding protein [Janthinobacterium sp. CG_23.3]|uniref:substrate-binding periplasmic protein n=1 Tax=unclassified Janthinobacterium TaxID=2610881 RepID=UPI0003464A99|nr:MULTISPECIES: ABC transporter substrate-binding protein [unclassified Janthinobacterium]MEC5159594.1 polar amino acid transport system substrate-binding protein [Janthinobacterium sp. CG_S6]